MARVTETSGGSSTIKSIINDKRQLLKDFGVEFTEEIENKIRSEIKAHPERAPQAIADSICRPYVMNSVFGGSWSQL